VSERKVALVTGGSRGVGRAIARQLAGKGFDVIVNYLRNEQAAAETLEEVRRQGGRGWSIQANVGDPAEVATLFEQVRGHGITAIDVLVHNAALGTFKPLLEIRPNQIEVAFQVNVFALLWLAKGALPMMSAGARIIALSSVGSGRVIPNYGIVGPSKAALESLVRYLAVELRPRGIRVNAVSGGLIETDALHAFPQWEEMVAQSVKLTPAGRLGEPDDLAEIVATFADGRLDWLCGQVLVADGGTTLR
jgi:enoyl-[acyl-carrier protein] reductase III